MSWQKGWGARVGSVLQFQPPFSEAIAAVSAVGCSPTGQFTGEITPSDQVAGCSSQHTSAAQPPPSPPLAGPLRAPVCLWPFLPGLIYPTARCSSHGTRLFLWGERGFSRQSDVGVWNGMSLENLPWCCIAKTGDACVKGFISFTGTFPWQSWALPWLIN